MEHRKGEEHLPSVLAGIPGVLHTAVVAVAGRTGAGRTGAVRTAVVRTAVGLAAVGRTGVGLAAVGRIVAGRKLVLVDRTAAVAGHWVAGFAAVGVVHTHPVVPKTKNRQDLTKIKLDLRLELFRSRRKTDTLIQLIS